MSAWAEAFVIFRTGSVPSETLEAARRSRTERNCRIELEARPGRVHILVECEGSDIEAMNAASIVAMTLIAAMNDDSAIIEGVRRSSAPRQPMRNVSLRGARPKPQMLMGEVSSPKPPPDNAREAFRDFMTRNRLRPTTWAKEAGIHSGEILGFLTGRSRGFSSEVAEKLARAARVRPEDMFR